MQARLWTQTSWWENPFLHEIIESKLALSTNPYNITREIAKLCLQLLMHPRARLVVGVDKGATLVGDWMLWELEYCGPHLGIFIGFGTCYACVFFIRFESKDFETRRMCVEVQCRFFCIAFVFSNGYSTAKPIKSKHVVIFMIRGGPSANPLGKQCVWNTHPTTTSAQHIVFQPVTHFLNISRAWHLISTCHMISAFVARFDLYINLPWTQCTAHYGTSCWTTNASGIQIS